MEKEALIEIILNDLNEMQTLVATFKGKSVINSAFIKLAHTKLNNISEELNLLDTLKNEVEQTKDSSESSLTSAASSSLPEEDGEKIATSSQQFFSEEASLKVAPSIGKETAEPTETPPAPKPTPTATEKETKTRPAKESIKTNKKTTKTQSDSNILGEKINSDRKLIHEQLSGTKESGNAVKQIGKPVNDVRKAIGINDRFFYQRELFQGNADLMNQTLDQLNQLDSFDSAVQFLHSNYHWEEDNEAAETFLKSIKRRFI